MKKAKIYNDKGVSLEVDYTKHTFTDNGLTLLKLSEADKFEPVIFIPHGLAIVEFKAEKTPKILITNVNKTAFKTYKSAQKLLLSNGEKIYPDVFDGLTKDVEIGDYLQIAVQDQKETCYLRVTEYKGKKRVKICDAEEVAECLDLLDKLKKD